MKKSLTWWLIIFVLLALFVFLLVPDPAEKVNTLKGLGIAAVVSLFFVFKSLKDWQVGNRLEKKRGEADVRVINQ